ncbi:hypothetical protein EJ03DRAFT_65499 [Teratosphaeria nubilosa]|uniref:Uncharacterized protein n=1 Tax=Teratosphaeria nubilosa TaxID=161662 RepID=A0A6G1KTN6_9PEZI|nr:hypothetical protein EJ03DRAFT_65499 [Teratosphaeria nubilosa]
MRGPQIWSIASCRIFRVSKPWLGYYRSMSCCLQSIQISLTSLVYLAIAHYWEDMDHERDCRDVHLLRLVELTGLSGSNLFWDAMPRPDSVMKARYGDDSECAARLRIRSKRPPASFTRTVDIENDRGMRGFWPTFFISDRRGTRASTFLYRARRLEQPFRAL